MRTLDAYGGVIGKAVNPVSGNTESKDTFPQGKKVILWNDQLVDMEQDSQGFRISVKGASIASGQLANIVAVFDCRGIPENTLRRVAYLRKEGTDTWAGEAFIPLKSQPPQGPFGGGANTVTQTINLSVYGDTLAPGEGDIEVEIGPYESSSEPPVKIARKIEVTGEHNNNEPLLSIPIEFQLTQYPGSKFDSGVRMNGGSTITLSFTTKDKPEFVYRYYKSEFANRGFKVADSDLLGEKVLKGANATQDITITIETNEDKETALNITIKPMVAEVPATSSSG